MNHEDRYTYKGGMERKKSVLDMMSILNGKPVVLAEEVGQHAYFSDDDDDEVWHFSMAVNEVYDTSESDYTNS